MPYIDGLMQKRRNSIAYALELCHFCIIDITSHILVISSNDMLPFLIQAVGTNNLL